MFWISSMVEILNIMHWLSYIFIAYEIKITGAQATAEYTILVFL